jgi:hypothetical protein
MVGRLVSSFFRLGPWALVIVVVVAVMWSTVSWVLRLLRDVERHPLLIVLGMWWLERRRRRGD